MADVIRTFAFSLAHFNSGTKLLLGLKKVVYGKGFWTWAPGKNWVEPLQSVCA
jgi:hypothetical protein